MCVQCDKFIKVEPVTLVLILIPVLISESKILPGADPGFPVGGLDPFWGGGGMDLQHGHFLVKIYVKTKEWVPWGGGLRRKILYVDSPIITYMQSVLCQTHKHIP